MNSTVIQFLLIAAATLSAFTLGSAKSSMRELAQGLFVPISFPVRTIGVWATNRLSQQQDVDLLSPTNPRDTNEIRRQNAELITRLANLEAQLDDLRQLSAEYDRLGSLRSLVQPARVVAGPIAPRQTLTIGITGLREIREKMPVVCPLGFLGQIYAVSLGNATARVLLATDPASHLSARFVRFIQEPNGTIGVQSIKTSPPLVDGDGRGMVVRALPAHEVRNQLHVGDVALLDDITFPPAVKGLRLGTIRKITLPPTDAGFAVIELDPTTNVSTLTEVLVVDK